MVIPEGVSSPDTILNIFAFKRTPFSPLFCDFFVVAVIILIEIFPNENKERRGWEGRLPGRPWVRAAPPLPAQPPGSRTPGLWWHCPLSGSGSGRAVCLSLPVHLLPLFQKEGPGSREV